MGKALEKSVRGNVKVWKPVFYSKKIKEHSQLSLIKKLVKFLI